MVHVHLGSAPDRATITMTLDVSDTLARRLAAAYERANRPGSHVDIDVVMRMVIERGLDALAKDMDAAPEFTR